MTQSIFEGLAGMARWILASRNSRRMVIGCLAIPLATCLLQVSSIQAQRVEVAFDDFENLHASMFPFTEPANVFADGTDWTNQIRVGTGREWVIDNSQMGTPPGAQAGGNCGEGGYNGWTAMDVASWTAEQGVQAGRTSLGLFDRNTAMIADPDAYYDFPLVTTQTNAYNSYVSRTYDLTGFDVSTLKITFDYEFAYEPNQTGVVEVSFDGGTTWQELLFLKQDPGDDPPATRNPPNNTIVTGPVTYEAGTDFSADSNQMILRFGCINADNNWWFAFDNVLVETVGAKPFFDLEDFEGLDLVPFEVATPPTESRFDGTDWTNVIPNWVIDNSQMLGRCREVGYDGWTVLDVQCWINEQGGQGRSFFSFGGFDANATFVADGDAFYDFDENFEGTGRAPGNGFNGYVSRTYDMSAYDNCDVKISFEFEFRAENQQRGTVEVSFDGGTTWTLLRELKTDPKNGVSNGDFIVEFVEYEATVDFDPAQSNTMILRFGYLEADNNWWFAFDNVLVEASVIDFVKGDANGDGSLNFDDIDPFVLALVDPAAFASQFPNVDPNRVLDFDCNGTLNFDDIGGFLNVLFGN